MSTKNYTIRVCYDTDGWAYYRRSTALQKNAPDDFHVTIGPNYGAAFRETRHDLVLQLCFPYARDIKRHVVAHGYDTLVVSGFNVATDYAGANFNEVARWSDHVIVNSRECWERLGRPPGTTWISNGVDRDIFSIVTPPAQRRTNVLWIGSTVHRSLKGYDDILQPLSDLLQRDGVGCEFRLVNPYERRTVYSADELAKWYNSGMIYVVTSSSEGTPNPALEAASAGCVIVSTRVGNMTELIEHGVNGEFIERNAESARRSIRRCIDEYETMSAAMQASIATWDWTNRAEQYFSLFRRLIDERRAEKGFQLTYSA